MIEALCSGSHACSTSIAQHGRSERDHGEADRRAPFLDDPQQRAVQEQLAEQLAPVDELNRGRQADLEPAEEGPQIEAAHRRREIERRQAVDEQHDDHCKHQHGAPRPRPQPMHDQRASAAATAAPAARRAGTSDWRRAGGRRAPWRSRSSKRFQTPRPAHHGGDRLVHDQPERQIAEHDDRIELRAEQRLQRRFELARGRTAARTARSATRATIPSAALRRDRAAVVLGAPRQMHQPCESAPGEARGRAEQRAERIERQIGQARHARGDVDLRDLRSTATATCPAPSRAIIDGARRQRSSSHRNRQKPSGRYSSTLEMRSPRPARAHDSWRNASSTPPSTASGLKLNGYSEP